MSVLPGYVAVVTLKLGAAQLAASVGDVRSLDTTWGASSGELSRGVGDNYPSAGGSLRGSVASWLQVECERELRPC